MNCKKIEILLSSLIDGEVNEKEKNTIKKHLDNCANCRQSLALLQNIKNSFATAERLEPQPFFETKIFSEIKNEQEIKPHLWLKKLVPAGVVVAVLIVLGLMKQLFLTNGKTDLTEVMLYEQHLTDNFEEEVIKIFYS